MTDLAVLPLTDARALVDSIKVDVENLADRIAACYEGCEEAASHGGVSPSILRDAAAYLLALADVWDTRAGRAIA